MGTGKMASANAPHDPPSSGIQDGAFRRWMYPCQNTLALSTAIQRNTANKITLPIQRAQIISVGESYILSVLKRQQVYTYGNDSTDRIDFSPCAQSDVTFLFCEVSRVFGAYVASHNVLSHVPLHEKRQCPAQ